jgi:hypothetical protein
VLRFRKTNFKYPNLYGRWGNQYLDSCYSAVPRGLHLSYKFTKYTRPNYLHVLHPRHHRQRVRLFRLSGRLRLPINRAIMYNNLAFSIIGVLFNLAGSTTVTAFITTANNIVNLFGEALGLKAGLGTRFLILTWASFGWHCSQICTCLLSGSFSSALFPSRCRGGRRRICGIGKGLGLGLVPRLLIILLRGR